MKALTKAVVIAAVITVAAEAMRTRRSSENHKGRAPRKAVWRGAITRQNPWEAIIPAVPAVTAEAEEGVASGLFEESTGVTEQEAFIADDFWPLGGGRPMLLIPQGFLNELRLGAQATPVNTTQVNDEDMESGTQ
ncbi:MAG: hypothetical protein LBR78_03270 [Holosporales bacterium]|jgi:hypothetical protein|nr:hypothetical protein [Holosporales bacterium]